MQWTVDVAVTCSIANGARGSWDNGVSRILLRGQATVQGGGGNGTAPPPVVTAVTQAEMGTEVSVISPGNGVPPTVGVNFTADYTLWVGEGWVWVWGVGGWGGGCGGV